MSRLKMMDYGELKKDILICISEQLEAMPKITVFDLPNLRCNEHQPQQEKFHDLWRYVWGLRQECDVADLSYITQMWLCENCLKILRLAPSGLAEYLAGFVSSEKEKERIAGSFSTAIH